MAITWGGRSRYARVGIDISISDTKATIKYYTSTSANAVADNQTMTLSGAIGGTVDYYMSTPNDGAVLVATRTLSLSRGTSFTVGANITGIYDGSSPSHTRSATIPAAAPNTMAVPKISGITSTEAVVSGNAPGNNGASIIDYTFQYATNAGFTTGLLSATRTSPKHIPTLTPNTKYWVRARARNSAGSGSWSGAAAFTTLNATPAAPTNLTLTGTKLTWTLSATANAPIANVEVERNNTKIATLGKVTTTDLSTTGLEKNTSYTYRVRATNPNGRSAYSNSVITYTTPAAPTNLKAVKDVAGNALLSWNGQAGYPVTYKVYARANAGAWSLLYTTASGATSYIHTTPDEKKLWEYSLIAVAPNALESARSDVSNTLVLLAAPLAPLLTAPANSSYLALNEDYNFTWVHQSTDFTPQTAANVTVGNTTMTVTTNEYKSIRPTSEGIYAYKVQTKGRHASYGPWSGEFKFIVKARPVLSVENPDGTASKLVISDWDSDKAISAYVASLFYEGKELERLEGKSVEPLVFKTITENHKAYEVRIYVVAAESGLASETVYLNWENDFPTPPAPEVEVVFNKDDGNCYISIQTPKPTSAELPAVSVDVYRQIDGGEIELLAEDLDTSENLPDPQCTIGGINTYYVYTHSIEDTSSLTTVAKTCPDTHDHCKAFVNYGAGFATPVSSRGHQFQDTPSLEQTLHTFAGRKLPYPVWGESETRVYSYTTNPHKKDESVFSEWVKAYQSRGQILYRDCTGRRIFGTMTGLNESAKTVTVKFEESDDTSF